MLKIIQQLSSPRFNTPFVYKRFYDRIAILQFTKVITTEADKPVMLYHKIFTEVPSF